MNEEQEASMAETATVSGERTWMNQEQAAQYCQLDPVTLWRARRDGRLKAGGVGRAIRYHRDELDRWLASGGPGRC